MMRLGSTLLGTRPTHALCVVAMAALFGILPSSSDAAQQPQANAAPQVTFVITDPSGANVADATVRVARGQDTHTATTGSNGMARFSGLMPGDWTVTVTRTGFEVKQQTVAVQPGALQISIVLDIAGVRENVEVASAAPPETIALDEPATGGSRLDIPVRDLPVSLSLVRQELIQERGARSAMEAVDLAVGMMAGKSDAGIPNYATRGFSGNSITLMRDGMRQNTISQSSIPLDPFVFDRIEVLKGPASVLYGEGAVGGALNIVSKVPQHRLGVEGLATYGSFGTSRVGLGVTGPLARTLLARIDGVYSNTEGYQDRSGETLHSVAGSIQWVPSNRVKAVGSMTYEDNDTSLYYGTPLIDGKIDPRTRKFNYNMQDNLWKSKNYFRRLDVDFTLSNNWKLRNETFSSTHRFNWRNLGGYAFNATTRLVDISSYFITRRNYRLVGDRLYARGQTNVFGRPFQLTGGIEVQHNVQHRDALSTAPVRFSVDPFNPAPIFDPGIAYPPDRDVNVDTVAGYAEAVLTATEQLKLVGGVRQERIALNSFVYATGIRTTPTYSPTTGRAGLVWSATKNVNLYGSYSRAVEPVGQFITLPPAQQGLDLSPGRQLEFGTKATGWNSRMDATVAYFHLDKRNILTTSIVNGLLTPQQVGQQVAKGIEISVAASPTSTLRVSGDLALTQSEFADFVEVVAGGNVARDGNLPPNVPERVWNLWASQRVRQFEVSGALRYVGARFADNANLRVMEDYTKLEAAVSYSPSRSYRVTVRGRNLTDGLYATWSVSNGTALLLEPPRSVDVTLAVKF